MAATATVECIVGLILVSGRLLRPGLALLAGCVLSWMSPLVLFPADLFAGGPTLEAQYILKDIVPARWAARTDHAIRFCLGYGGTPHRGNRRSPLMRGPMMPAPSDGRRRGNDTPQR